MSTLSTHVLVDERLAQLGRQLRPAQAASRRQCHAGGTAPAGCSGTGGGAAVVVTVGPFTFKGHLEEAAAPRTCALVRGLLPHADNMIQARWSGFAGWVPSPLGAQAELPVLPAENATMVPLPGQLLFYPGGKSEVEILFPYGPTVFKSVAGTLAGNHFLTLTEGLEQLEALGQRVQWEGAQDITIALAG